MRRRHLRIASVAFVLILGLFEFQNCSEVGFQGESINQASSTSLPPDTYAWTSSGWGTCSASCGGGTQTQTVTCVSSNGSTVDGGFCGGAKPPTSQVCNSQACSLPPPPPTYSWSQSGWGACSAVCGPGTQTQNVTCVSNTGAAVADSFCTTAKPAVSQTCTGSCQMPSPAHECAGGLYWNCIVPTSQPGNTGNGVCVNGGLCMYACHRWVDGVDANGLPYYVIFNYIAISCNGETPHGVETPHVPSP